MLVTWWMPSRCWQTQKRKQAKFLLQTSKGCGFMETRNICLLVSPTHGSTATTKLKAILLFARKEKGKTPFVKSLDTQDRSEALVSGRMLYQEVKGKIARGEKSRSLITSKLIEKYLASESKKITTTESRNPKNNIRCEVPILKNLANIHR